MRLLCSITAGNFMWNLHCLLCLYWHYKLILRLAGSFGFLQMTFLLNKSARHPWLMLCEPWEIKLFGTMYERDDVNWTDTKGMKN